MIARNQLTGVVLAGGQARRMGGFPKPLLQRPDGRTVLRAIIDELASVTREVVVVVTPERAPELGADAHGRIVLDAGGGPAAALAAAACVLDTEWLALFGGDHPEPHREIVLRLSEAAGPGIEAVVAVFGGRWQPLGALYHRASVLRLAGVAGLTGASLRGLLDQLCRVEIPTDSWPEPVRRGFLGVNTREEAEAAGLRD